MLGKSWWSRLPEIHFLTWSILAVANLQIITVREAAMEQCNRHSDYTAWSILNGIEAIPAADVAQVRHGRWVKIYENGEPAIEQHQVGVFCSRCKKMPKDRFTESDFCPNCGVKMDLER